MEKFLNFDLFTSINESTDQLQEDYANMYNRLTDAIKNKFVCTIYYRGERKGIVDDGYRYIEPVALGVNKQGNTVLRAWLQKGTSRTGKIDPTLVPGWRLFRLDRVSLLSPTLQQFTEKPGYNADDQGMSEVTISVDF